MDIKVINVGGGNQLEPMNFIIVGRRNNGKSTFAKYIINLYSCPTIIMTKHYIPNILDEYHDIQWAIKKPSFDAEVIENIINSQKEFKKKNGYMLPFLLVIDDLIGNKTKYSDELVNLFSTSRHLNISIIFISQHMAYVNPVLRNNSDYIAIFRHNIGSKTLSEITDGMMKPKELREIWSVKYRFLLANLQNDNFIPFKLSLD